MMYQLLLSLFMILSFIPPLLSIEESLWEKELELIPVAYKGRHRPLSVASTQLIRQFSEQEEKDALALWFTLFSNGAEPLKDRPLFWIRSAKTKRELQLPTEQNRFSYKQLQKAVKNLSSTTQETKQIVEKLQLFNKQGAENTLLFIPSRLNPEIWLPLSAVHTPLTTSFLPEQEKEISLALTDLLQAIQQEKEELSAAKKFRKTLLAAHEQAGTAPKLWRLQAELLYHSRPWPLLSALLYTGAALLFFLSRKKTPQLAYLFLLPALAIHTALLLARIAILERPPVSNMFETALYVPWIAVLTACFFSKRLQSVAVVCAGTLISALLLLLTHYTGIDSSMENVQAVLRSNFWLTIHVLMIVGSYGILFVNGFLAHLALAFPLKAKPLERPIRDTLYIGLALLITGTILGGVWAAESWGRFWDWDPKESWAFITSCLYLIVMHLHRYRWIDSWGLSVGCVIGMASVAFTWYGVNYILGTGLHSYGFGQGGQWMFWGYLGFELLFILCCISYRPLNSIK